MGVEAGRRTTRKEKRGRGVWWVPGRVSLCVVHSYPHVDNRTRRVGWAKLNKGIRGPYYKD